MRDDFAVFILSHGRPNRIYTLRSLNRVGYTGDYYIVVDDEDEALERYKTKFGDKVIVFSKQEAIEKTDRGVNLDNRQIVCPARNQCFAIAKDLGYSYFMELDDDYDEFKFRFDQNFEYNPYGVKLDNFDEVLNELIKLYQKTDATVISFAQGGDFFGGKDGSIAQALKIKRKAMNTMLFRTDKPVKFMGSINEDVNAYVRLQQLGRLFFMVNTLSVDQKETQTNPEGLTNIYLSTGTYIKSFYTILYSPSCVKLRTIGRKKTTQRIHHAIQWRNAVPKIVSDEYKKS